MHSAWKPIALSVAVVLAAVGWATDWPLDLRADRARGSTAPERAPAGTFIRSVKKSPAIVWAVGDGDAGPGARKLVRYLSGVKIDRFLYLGDVYESGTAAEFSTNYEPTYGRLARVTAPTPGNHDWPLHGEGYDPYWKQVTGRRPPAYYSFRVAGWEILSLNSESDHDAGSKQVEWLRRRLERPGTCRLAFWHRPRLNAGKHGDQDDVAPFWDALRGHARIVVNGHDHNLQRLKRTAGITELVSGAGGRSHYELDSDDHRLAFENDTDFGALRLRLSPGAARFAFVTAGGRKLDSGRLRCRRR